MKQYARHLIALSSLVAVGATLVTSQPVFAAPMNASELNDVNSSHWAYPAIKALLEKYGVMEGFPDKTFKGSRNTTRYEIAAALYKVMSKIESMGGAVSAQDLKTLKDLSDEFKRDLEDVKKNLGVQDERLKKVEAAIEELKQGGSFRYGGSITTSIEEVFGDPYRPTWGTSFEITGDVKLNDEATFKTGLSAGFTASAIGEEEDKDTKEKKTIQKSDDPDALKAGITQGWVDWKSSNQTFKPRVAVGYMGAWELISGGTTLGHRFNPWDSIVGLVEGSAVSKAGPNVGKIRVSKTVNAGGSMNFGPLNARLLGNSEVLFAQVGADLGFAKLKLVADMDQGIIFGNSSASPLHNEKIVLDIGSADFLGLSLQGYMRNFEFRGASTYAKATLMDFELGLSAKYIDEGDKVEMPGDATPRFAQALYTGAYLKSPAKWGEVDIPFLLIGVQEPLTLIDGYGLYEGAMKGVDDPAGFMVQINYNNPILPNLALEYSQRSKLLFDTGDGIISDTFAIKSSYDF